MTKPPVANTWGDRIGKGAEQRFAGNFSFAFRFNIGLAARHRANVEHGPAEGHDGSANSLGMLAGNLNSSALADVRHRSSPISRDAGAASGASEISVPWVICASTESRGARVTPMPAATICADVCKLPASNVVRRPRSIPPNQ
ncbi:MAG: hypothetical protein OXI57_11920 [Rhodospirillales bacterium]|nr:hypothetical protein [Rhodospirillales bacterium]